MSRWMTALGAKPPFTGMSASEGRSQPIDATLYLRGKRWSVGWNGDFIEVLRRQRRRSYGIAGSAGSRNICRLETMAIILQSTVGGFSTEFERNLPWLEKEMIARGLDPSQFV